MSNSKVLGTVQLSEGPLQGEFTVRKSTYLMDPEVNMIFLDAEDGVSHPLSVILSDHLMYPGKGRTFLSMSDEHKPACEALQRAGIVQVIKPIRFGRKTASLCKVNH